MDQQGINLFGMHLSGPESMFVAGILAIFGSFAAAEFGAKRTVDVVGGTARHAMSQFNKS